MWSDPRVKPPPGVARWDPESWAAPGCVGYWACNEGGGSRVYDYSPYGNHGTMTNMDPQTDWGAGESGAALDFDGINDRVIIPNVAAALYRTNRATLSCWVNLDDDSADHRAFGAYKGGGQNQIYVWWDKRGEGDGWTAGIVTNGTSGNAGTGATPYAVDDWQHVAVTWDGNWFRIYVDGKGTGNSTSAFDGALQSPGATYDYQFGAWESGGQMRGIGENAAIYDRALSDDEIKRLHEEPYAAIVQPPRVWYFDTGALAAADVVPPLGTPDVARVSLLSADAAAVRLLTSVERVELNVD